MNTDNNTPSDSGIEAGFKDIDVQFNARSSELHKLQIDPQEIEKQAGSALGLISDGKNIGGALGLGIATKALTIFSAYVKSQENALIDGVTGLLNRKGILAAGAARLAHTERNGGSTAVFFLDLNKFKPINDTLGHPEGDDALRLVAQSMQQWLRAEDLKARFAGDEFVIIMSNSDPNHNFEPELHKVKTLCNEVIVHQGSDNNLYPIGASVGMIKVAPGETIDAAIDRADKLMYIDKQQSKRSRERQADVSTYESPDLTRD